MKDELDWNKLFRMLWYDVQCVIWGFVCCDVVRYFVQRWNFVKWNKVFNIKVIFILLLYQYMVIFYYFIG